MKKVSLFVFVFEYVCIQNVCFSKVCLAEGKGKSAFCFFNFFNNRLFQRIIPFVFAVYEMEEEKQ
jgi:hypothetical protein